MMHSLKFSVVKFSEFHNLKIPKYACVPSSWIKVLMTKQKTKQVMVAYPKESSKHTKKRVRNEEEALGKWKTYLATVVFETDHYDDADIHIDILDTIDVDRNSSIPTPTSTNDKFASLTSKEEQISINNKLANSSNFNVKEPATNNPLKYVQGSSKKPSVSQNLRKHAKSFSDSKNPSKSVQSLHHRSAIQKSLSFPSNENTKPLSTKKHTHFEVDNTGVRVQSTNNTLLATHQTSFHWKNKHKNNISKTTSKQKTKNEISKGVFQSTNDKVKKHLKNKPSLSSRTNQIKKHTSIPSLERQVKKNNASGLSLKKQTKLETLFKPSFKNLIQEHATAVPSFKNKIKGENIPTLFLENPTQVHPVTPSVENRIRTKYLPTPSLENQIHAHASVQSLDNHTQEDASVSFVENQVQKDTSVPSSFKNKLKTENLSTLSLENQDQERFSVLSFDNQIQVDASIPSVENQVQTDTLVPSSSENTIKKENLSTLSLEDQDQERFSVLSFDNQIQVDASIPSVENQVQADTPVSSSSENTIKTENLSTLSLEDQGQERFSVLSFDNQIQVDASFPSVENQVQTDTLVPSSSENTIKTENLSTLSLENLNQERASIPSFENQIQEDASISSVENQVQPDTPIPSSSENTIKTENLSRLSLENQMQDVASFPSLDYHTQQDASVPSVENHTQEDASVPASLENKMKTESLSTLSVGSQIQEQESVPPLENHILEHASVLSLINKIDGHASDRSLENQIKMENLSNNETTFEKLPKEVTFTPTLENRIKTEAPESVFEQLTQDESSPSFVNLVKSIPSLEKYINDNVSDPSFQNILNMLSTLENQIQGDNILSMPSLEIQVEDKATTISLENLPKGETSTLSIENRTITETSSSLLQQQTRDKNYNASLQIRKEDKLSIETQTKYNASTTPHEKQTENGISTARNEIPKASHKFKKKDKISEKKIKNNNSSKQSATSAQKNSRLSIVSKEYLFGTKIDISERNRTINIQLLDTCQLKSLQGGSNTSNHENSEVKTASSNVVEEFLPPTQNEAVVNHSVATQSQLPDINEDFSCYFTTNTKSSGLNAASIANQYVGPQFQLQSSLPPYPDSNKAVQIRSERQENVCRDITPNTQSYVQNVANITTYSTTQQLHQPLIYTNKYTMSPDVMKNTIRTTTACNLTTNTQSSGQNAASIANQYVGPQFQLQSSLPPYPDSNKAVQIRSDQPENVCRDITTNTHSYVQNAANRTSYSTTQQLQQPLIYTNKHTMSPDVLKNTIQTTTDSISTTNTQSPGQNAAGIANQCMRPQFQLQSYLPQYPDSNKPGQIRSEPPENFCCDITHSYLQNAANIATYSTTHQLHQPHIYTNKHTMSPDVMGSTVHETTACNLKTNTQSSSRNATAVANQYMGPQYQLQSSLPQYPDSNKPVKIRPECQENVRVQNVANISSYYTTPQSHQTFSYANTMQIRERGTPVIDLTEEDRSKNSASASGIPQDVLQVHLSNDMRSGGTLLVSKTKCNNAAMLASSVINQTCHVPNCPYQNSTATPKIHLPQDHSSELIMGLPTASKIQNHRSAKITKTQNQPHAILNRPLTVNNVCPVPNYPYNQNPQSTAILHSNSITRSIIAGKSPITAKIYDNLANVSNQVPGRRNENRFTATQAYWYNSMQGSQYKEPVTRNFDAQGPKNQDTIMNALSAQQWSEGPSRLQYPPMFGLSGQESQRPYRDHTSRPPVAMETLPLQYYSQPYQSPHPQVMHDYLGSSNQNLRSQQTQTVKSTKQQIYGQFPTIDFENDLLEAAARSTSRHSEENMFSKQTVEPSRKNEVFLDGGNYSLLGRAVDSNDKARAVGTQNPQNIDPHIPVKPTIYNDSSKFRSIDVPPVWKTNDNINEFNTYRQIPIEIPLDSMDTHNARKSLECLEQYFSDLRMKVSNAEKWITNLNSVLLGTKRKYVSDEGNDNNDFEKCFVPSTKKRC